MKVEFQGAAACVTGSGHLIKIFDKNILLDCGMYQGKDAKERGNESFNFNPRDIHYIILSHAHIDHSGRIPYIYKQGFRGKILCTEATMDLCGAMLADSAHILQYEAEWKNKRNLRQGLEPVEPLYTPEIAQQSMRLFSSVSYNEWIELFEGFKFRFIDAGHLLGSAITEIIINENRKEYKLVYSGDLGNENIPLLKDPETVQNADYLIMESTYGDRLHETGGKELDELVNVIKRTFKRGGNVIIPSFAVGRAQELLYTLNKYMEEDLIPSVPVFIDSPLATESTRIFNKHSKYFDAEATALINSGDDPLHFKSLFFTKTPEESMALNKIKKGAIIISASGMCEAGRIKHHLKHNLWRSECSVVFVGYQVEGTLGRSIVDGAKSVRIFGEYISVNAEIVSLQGLSGHADREGLHNWLKNIKIKPNKVILVHGDREAQKSFQLLLNSEGYNTFIPNPGDVFVPGINRLAESSVKDKITMLLETIDDVDAMPKDKLLELIRNAINS
ncbi:MAG: MBL fold metallo-hydrolase RNA specificity domain-containing protein [Clostridiaceae bacterium]